MRFSTKVTALNLGLIGLSALLIAAVVYVSARQVLSAHLHEEVVFKANYTMRLLDTATHGEIETVGRIAAAGLLCGGDRQAAQHYLGQRQEAHPLFLSLTYFPVRGGALTVPDGLVYDEEAGDAVPALGSRQPGAVAVRYSPLHGVSTLQVLVPAACGGTLLARVDIHAFFDALTSPLGLQGASGERVRLDLYDRDGLLLFSSDHATGALTEYHHHDQFVSDERYIRALAGQDRLPEGGGNGWKLVASVARAQSKAVFRELQHRLVWVLVPVTALGLLLSWLFGQRTTAILRRLSASMNASGTHKLAPADLARRDEFGGFVRSVDAMLGRLRQVQGRLESSEARLKLALWAGGDGLWEWDLDTARLHTSREWNAMLGYEAAERDWTVQAWQHMIHPLDLAEFSERLNRVLNGHSDAFESEHRLRSVTGEWLWVLDRGRVVERNTQGRGMRLAGTQTNIDERKRLERELAHTTSIYQTVAEFSINWVYWRSADRNQFIFTSTSCEDLTGYSAEQFKGDGRLLDRIIHPEDRAVWDHHLEQVVRHGHSHTPMELRIVTRDREVRWVAHQCKPVFDSNGEYMGRRGNMADISERKRSELALQTSEEKFRSLAENMPGAVYRCALDRNWSMQFISSGIQALSGYAATDFTARGGRSYRELIHPEDLDQVETTLAEANADGDHYVLEYRIVTLSGEVRWVYEKGQVRFAEHWRQGWRDGILIDHTARKLMEQELQRLARTDTLTGALNRRHFGDSAERELARHERYRRPLTVLMLDLDHFKSINDRFGHATGDEVLKVFTGIVRSSLRTIDLLGRLGGEEFAVLLPETALQGGVEVAERITAASRGVVVKSGDEGVRFTVSIGVAQYRGDKESMDGLLRRADGALYAAKEQGRDRVVAA